MNEAEWAFLILCLSLAGSIAIKALGLQAIGVRMVLGVAAGSSAFIYLTPATPITHASLFFGALAPWTFLLSVPAIRGTNTIGRNLVFGAIAFIVAWILSFFAMGLSLHSIARSVMLMQSKALPDYVFSIFAIGIFTWFGIEAAGGSRQAGNEALGPSSTNYAAQITFPFLIALGLTVVMFFNPPTGLLSAWLPEDYAGRSLVGYRPLISMFNLAALAAICMAQVAAWCICVYLDRTFVPGRLEHHMRFAATAAIIAIAAQVMVGLILRSDGIFESDELRRTMALSVSICLTAGLVSTSLALALGLDVLKPKRVAEAT